VAARTGGSRAELRREKPEGATPSTSPGAQHAGGEGENDSAFSGKSERSWTPGRVEGVVTVTAPECVY